MKRLLAGFLAFTALTAPAFAVPQPAPANTPAANPTATTPPAAAPIPDVDPALWVVRDADTTIYLFGTFHVLDGRRAWFNDEVKEAFDRSNELVLELRLPSDPAQLRAEMGPLIQRLAIDSEGRTLSTALTADEYKKLYELMVGVPVGALDRMEPWFLSLTLTNVLSARLALDPAYGPERILTEAAAARGMPVTGLETFESQFAIFDGTPRAEQIDALKKMIANPEESLGLLPQMIDAWSTGNADRIAAITSEGFAADRAGYDRLFTERNAAWARWIKDRMDRPGVVFMAVGVGHLAGRGSVQQQLEERGIRSARVPAAR